MSLKNYDPARVFGENLATVRVFPFKNAELGKRTLYIPERHLEGKDENAVLEDVKRSYDAFRRAEEYAESQTYSCTDKEAMRRATELYTVVHHIITANCCSVYLARLKDDTEEARAEQAYLDDLNEKVDINEHLVEALEKSAEVLCKQWLEDNGPEHARELVRAANFHMTKQLAAAAILKADEEVPEDAPEEEWHAAFDELYRAQIENGLEFIYSTYVQSEAQDILENDVKPVEMPLEKLRMCAGIVYLSAKTEHSEFSEHAAAQAVSMIVATSKLAGHMNGFITNRKENFVTKLPARKNGRPELVSARSRLDLPRGVERPDTVELLERMHKTLLRHKEESASLLKTHMYLVDCAYKRGGDGPTFVVNMDDLLEAKGYTRRADGGFQASTYREEWGRIATLAGCWLELRRVTEKNKRGKEETFIEETPYWEVRARRRLEEGEALGLEAILLEDPSAPIIKAVVIQPGLWWGVSDRGTMNFHLPREVLALPTDGKGNETQRMAVQLAATLALWMRASQNQHAGKECAYSVGALLEASGVKTRLEFEQERIDGAKRLRKYLAGTPDEPSGALHHLTALGAFAIHIRDEEEFWASGRGWQTRFWESGLAVKVPDLGIKKFKKPRTKRAAPKQAPA